MSVSSLTALPADFAFREVTTPSSPADGRALETIHKLLQDRQSERFAVHDGDLSTDEATAEPTVPAKRLMLLGIMSGNEDRRRVLRCPWARSPAVLREIRVLFVVGKKQPMQTEWELGPAESMELRVNISEGVRVWQAAKAGLTRKTQSFTGTFSTYFKQATFLRFAATQPEPLIGRADDDVFISPHMLLAYARVLRRMPQPFAAGTEPQFGRCYHHEAR